MFENIIQTAREAEFVAPEYFSLTYALAVISVLVVIGFCAYLIIRPAKSYGSKYPRIGKLKSSVFITLSCVSAIFALARPVVTFPTESYSMGPADMIIAVDISASMWADDFKPSRLDIAVREIIKAGNEGIIKKGDRVSLVVFGAKPSTRAYLTGELDFFFNEVAKLGPPNFIGGDLFSWDSNLPEALREIYISADILDRFNDSSTLEEFLRNDGSWSSEKRKNRFAVLFTDGDFNFDGANSDIMRNAISELNNRGIDIYVVAIGTRKGINLLSSIRRIKTQPNVLKEMNLQLAGVVTSLNTAILSSIVSDKSGNGIFVIDKEEKDSSGFLKRITEIHRGGVEKVVLDQDTNELWHYFIILSFVFLALTIIFY